MDLSKMVDERLVKFDMDASSKEDAIRKVAALMYTTGKVSDQNVYIQGVLDREKEFATGIGMHIAIPHCKNQVVTEAAFTMVKLKQGIDWGSFDGLPVNFIIHLTMLSTLARNLMDDDFRSGLLEATSVEDIEKVLQKGV